MGAQPIKRMAIEPLTKRKAWNALEIHYRKVRGLHLRDLFAADPKRGERLTAEALGIFLDYSKNRVTDETLNILIQLAEESGLRARIEAMFRGERINITENRSVLPSWDIFDHQPQEYRDSVLPPGVNARLAIEQASTFGWEHYTGLEGRIIGMKTFGASAPLKELQRRFGFEPHLVAAATKQLLERV